ncbi:MAG: Trigger factor [Candidatus Saccharibacteria bacterium]|nr:Trigger factor [Candidatus Saccharibacteria bacterium]
MQVKKTVKSETEVVLLVTADASDLTPLKAHVLGHFKDKVKLAGFRQGKAPLDLVEKNIDQQEFQAQFIDEALNHLYPQAAQSENLRPVDSPQVTLKKFVPFTELEFEATVPVLGEVKLADYKKVKKTKKDVEISEKDVTEVIESLQKRLSEKKDVDRASKDGDQVWIDFKGVDEKGESVKGADGKDYPLVLGSKTFIPGFEENLVGLKAGDEKTFTLTFPKDYGVAALANRNVTFTATVTKVQEVLDPKVDDEFAAKAGPFKTVKELKDDIKKQLVGERQYQADRDFESEIVKEIAEKSSVTIPQVLIDEQVERLLRDLQQNLMYRGMTYQEFLEAEGKTEEEYKKDVLAPQAEERVKAGLILAEIADKENVQVTPEELEIRLMVLKGQYPDEGMQAELDKPENRREIAARMVTEKTVNKLVEYATSK